MGFEVPGYLGGNSYSTPNIDRLSREGMQLNHVFASPSCHPSRIMLMTGRYPFEFRELKWGAFPTDTEGITLASVLKRANYATAIAGKWQLALLKEDPDHARRLGFDESFLFGWHEGPRYHGPYVYRNGDAISYDKATFGPDLYREFLIEFMRENVDRPFFAYYSMALPHAVSDDLESPPPYPPGKDRWNNYAEMVSDLDESIGLIVRAIEELGIKDNTLIIVTSDNGTPRNTTVRHDDGEYIRERNISDWRGVRIPGGKTTLKDTGIRVPTLAIWPGVIRPGTRSDALIDFTDFLPTFSDIAGVPRLNEPVTGKSFAGLFIDTPYSPRKWIFSQQLGPDPEYCVRNEQWKLDHTGRLFRIDRDLKETRIEELSWESWESFSDLNDVIWTLRKAGLQ